MALALYTVLSEHHSPTPAQLDSALPPRQETVRIAKTVAKPVLRSGASPGASSGSRTGLFKSDNTGNKTMTEPLCEQPNNDTRVTKGNLRL